MKVLILNGSPNVNGSTSRAISEMINIFNENKIEVETIMIGNKEVRGCIDCSSCRMTGKCVFDDILTDVKKKFEEADGLILASPVYYASANGTLIALLDRLFHSSKFNKTMKVGASIAVARRGGITATHDELNKYFTISGMPIASGQYWNGYYGSYDEEVQDLEGLQQMRTLARNMIFLMKSIELGKKEFGIPEKEKFIATNFIRK